MIPEISYDDFEKLAGEHGIRLRDMLVSHKHFFKWCDAKGYGNTDPSGKSRGSSQIWFAEYQDDPEGEAKCPPYLDTWHWLIHHAEEKGIDWITTDDAHAMHLPLLRETSFPDWAKPAFDHLFNKHGDTITMYMYVSR